MKLIRVLLPLAVLAAVSSVQAQWSISGDDGSLFDDASPVLYGKGVAWVRDWSKIMYWDGKTTVELYSGSIGHHSLDERGYLQGAGKLLAWIDDDLGEIMAWDGKQVRQLTDDALPDGNIDTDGKWVVWEKDTGFQEIMAWDGKQVFQVTDNAVNDVLPSVSGGRVTWLQVSGPDYHVMLWEKGTTTDLSALAAEPPQVNTTPVVEGKTVAWAGGLGYPYSRVYVYDGNQVTVVSSPGATTIRGVAVGGGSVAWVEDDKTVCVRCKGVTSRITVTDDAWYLSVWGTRVVWQSFPDSDDPEILLYNTKTAKTYFLTANGGSEKYPKTNGKRVTWQSEDNGPELDVFVFPGPSKLP